METQRFSQDNSETNQHSQSISPPPKPCQGLQISVDSGPELSKLPPKASSAAEAHSNFEILACSSVSFGEVKCILSVNAKDTERQREREIRNCAHHIDGTTDETTLCLTWTISHRWSAFQFNSTMNQRLKRQRPTHRHINKNPCKRNPPPTKGRQSERERRNDDWQ